MSYDFNDKSATDRLIKKMIPVLVRWAQASWDSTHYYQDLQYAIGSKTAQLGYQLGRINEVFTEISKTLGYKIPTLNALVASKKNGLPSPGLAYVDDSYSTLSDDAKRAYMQARNKEAHEFDWTPVLNELGLKPATIFTIDEIKKIRSNSNHIGGGESNAHKLLKQKVESNPKSIGIDDECKVETEHSLLSGDRIDVYFETDNDIYGVEVKSIISSEDDIIRGIFQCIKYQAVLEKEQIFAEHCKNIHTKLVIEGSLTYRCQQIVNDLGIEVIEKFNIT